MPGNSPKRGDIYHVDFSPPVGARYAVVVTRNSINMNANAVVVATITSKRTDKIYPHEFKISPGLMSKPSKVKCQNLIMLPKGDLTEDNYFDTLMESDIPALNTALRKALDL